MVGEAAAHVQAACLRGAWPKAVAVVSLRLTNSPSTRKDKNKKLPMKTPSHPILQPPVPAIDEIQDSLDAIMAISDLLGFVGTDIEPGRLHDRTVADAAFLIQRENRHIALLLGLRCRDFPAPENE